VRHILSNSSLLVAAVVAVQDSTTARLPRKVAQVAAVVDLRLQS
jgi:hypothetical protein